MELSGPLCIHVKNWNSFQHYKDRSPAWIKLHKSLLDDYDYQRLPLASRALAPMLWLLASEYKDGVILATVGEIAFRLRCSDQEVLDAINPLIQKGFLIVEQDASRTLAEPEQLASLEKRREYKPEIDPPTPQRGKRRSRIQVIAEYPEGTRKVVNECLALWPKTRPGNQSAIQPDVPLLASRVDENLKIPNVTPELLVDGAKLYLAEEKQFPHAPEFYFGPGKNGEPPWRAYSRMAFHSQQQAVTS